MWFTNQDGKKNFEWVVWGEQKECCLFDKTYQYKGHAIRRAKKLIKEGDKACVVSRGNWYQVMKGNILAAWIISLARIEEDSE